MFSLRFCSHHVAIPVPGAGAVFPYPFPEGKIEKAALDIFKQGIVGARLILHLHRDPVADAPAEHHRFVEIITLQRIPEEEQEV